MYSFEYLIKIKLNMRLIEKLQYLPKGYKLYSHAFGEVRFDGIIKNDMFDMICVTDELGDQHIFYEDGKLSIFGEDELFPSKENKDWSTFNNSQPTSYLKCCELLNINPLLNEVSGYECDALNNLQMLLVFYKAWLLLDNNWTPNWDDCEEIKYAIKRYHNNNVCEEVTTTPSIFTFRTSKMAVDFKTTFAHYLNKCSQFI